MAELLTDLMTSLEYLSCINVYFDAAVNYRVATLLCHVHNLFAYLCMQMQKIAFNTDMFIYVASYCLMGKLMMLLNQQLTSLIKHTLPYNAVTLYTELD